MRVSRPARLLVVGVLAAIGFAAPATTADAAVQPLVITTTAVADATAGVPYSATLKATGGAFFKRWSVSAGSLPAGLKLNAQGRITGTPQAEGSSSFTVSVQDNANPRHTATVVLDLTVLPMHITTPSLPVVPQGMKYSTQLTAVGGTKPYKWSLVAGELPGSLTLSSSGRLSGNSGVFGGGPHDIIVQITDKAHRTAVRSYQLVVKYMEITTTAVPAAKKNRYYSFKVKSYAGCTNPQWTVHDANRQGPTNGRGQGILPDGLLIGSGSGTIGGVPRTAGTFEFTVLARCPGVIFYPYAWSTVLTLTVT